MNSSFCAPMVLGVPSWASAGPSLFIFLFCVVFLRAQTTYLLGYLATGALKRLQNHRVVGGIARWFNGAVPKKGAQLLERWGLLIIPLCFLTVGIQTAINAGAGITRMKWRTYTLMMIPGCIAWAFMYGLGMMAIYMTIAGTVAGHPLALVTFMIIVILAAFFMCRHLKKAGKSQPSNNTQAHQLVDDTLPADSE